MEQRRWPQFHGALLSSKMELTTDVTTCLSLQRIELRKKKKKERKKEKKKLSQS